jgi:hypothetical protein
MAEVNNVGFSGTSEDIMYEAYVDYLSGNKEYSSSYKSNKPKKYEHSDEVKNLIPDLDYEAIDRSKCKDDNEYYAKKGLIACLKDLKKILTDSSISDEQSWMIYNTLVTYVEYHGENNTSDGRPINKDDGLDDILSFLKSKDGINGDFRGEDMIDSKAFRELVTDIQKSLKKIKEETALDVPDRKRLKALAYFTGDRDYIENLNEEEEEKK